MLGLMCVIAGAALVIAGPIPVDIAYFNQVVGVALIVGGPWAMRHLFGR